MKTTALIFALLGSLSLASFAFADAGIFGLSANASKVIGKGLRAAHLAGDTTIASIGGGPATIYSSGQLECMFRNSDDSVNCDSPQDLMGSEAAMIGGILRADANSAQPTVHFEGGPQVTTYSVGNLACYFQNDDDSVSCSVIE